MYALGITTLPNYTYVNHYSIKAASPLSLVGVATRVLTPFKPVLSTRPEVTWTLPGLLLKG
jgi:hypothetical protein